MMNRGAMSQEAIVVVGAVTAVIARSFSGGPVRMIITGRRNIRTGLFVSVKGGWRQLPWESFKGERFGVMHYAEVSSGVTALMAQPHRLEIYRAGITRPELYFPDFELEVTPSFLASLQRGESFADTAVRNYAVELGRSERRKVIIEVKSHADKRNHDERYMAKLKTAKQIYETQGMPFITLMQEDHFDSVTTSVMGEILPDARVAFDEREIAAVAVLMDRNRGRASYGQVAGLLGAGPIGRAKLHAMHVRQHVVIDVSSPMTTKRAVHFVQK